jgi:hypothetical protein
MIKIKYSCPESSSEMQDTSCGKFCSSCQQIVYDFREKSQEEIIEIRANNPSVKCGLFTREQASVDSRTAVQNVFRMAFAAIFVLGFNATMLFGQTVNTIALNDATVAVTDTVANKIIISGTVTNENGVGIAAEVKYFFNDEYVIIKTDEQGQFEFELPEGLLGQKINLQFYAKGFKHVYITTTNLKAKCYKHLIRLGEIPDRNSKTLPLMGFF